MAKAETMPDIELEPMEATPLYRHSFFSEEMRESRKQLTATLILPLVYTSLLMWACLSLYWASLLPSNNLNKLTVVAVDLDHGFLGAQVMQGIQGAASPSPDHLNWIIGDGITSSADSESVVLDEQAWAVVQVSPNASSSLDEALRAGDASYNPLSAVSIYAATARNQITANSHVIPAILAIVNPLLNKAGAIHTAQFLGTVSNNSSALQTALHCPQCIASPYAANQTDFRPFDSPTASASTMVGLIFLLTFAFSIFQTLRTVGLVIGSKMNLRSALVFRTVNALLAYFVISLWYTLINLAFGVPMGRYFGHGGFVIYWMLNWMTMAAVGLPLESLFTVIGMKWAGYFLSFWIIVNVASAFTSFELMPGFFQYGYGFPFFNSIQGARTIIFGTKNHLGRNFGILIAWMIIGLLGVYLFTFLQLRANRRAGSHHIL
ncbi:MAG: hypothetical protein M1838_004598 [Thelocarpon superellum]|nr:MAG: hypothetical protein M1838_004598 [Thelocarpon superellum]